MSRGNYNNTANFHRFSGTIPISSYPFSMFAWHKPSDLSNSNDSGNILGFFDASDPSERILLYSGGGGDSKLKFVVQGASFTRTSSSVTATMTTGKWHTCLGVIATNLIYAILDGETPSSPGAPDTFPSGFDRVSIGRWDDSTPNLPLYGHVAHAAIWDVELDTVDAAALTAGVSPLLIKPESLVFYAPMTGASTTDEIDIIGGLTLSENGTVGTDENPLVAVGWPSNVITSAAAATNREVDATTASYAWTEQTSTVNRERGVDATTASYSWAELNATVNRERTVSAALAAYAWTELVADVEKTGNRDVNATAAAYAWTEIAADVTRGLNISATVESYAWTELAAVINRSRNVTGIPANWTWTEIEAAVQRGDEVIAEATKGGMSMTLRQMRELERAQLQALLRDDDEVIAILAAMRRRLN